MNATAAMVRRTHAPRPRVPELGALIGVAAFLGLVVVALFGERIAPHEPIYFVVEHGKDPRPYDPGLVFPFGSDVLGRDLVSLVVAGARATLAIVLISGIARVVAGALVATLGSWWRPGRVAIEWLAELASAVPATLVALVLVKIFVKAETNLLVFIAALLVTGWAGPYRVIRAELDRLASMPFTQGARAIGVGRWRLFWRHHLPNLVPIVALNTSQQVVASLVLVAELGVLGVALGLTRTINIEESLSRVVPTQVNVAQISDPPEWGGLLASARTIESLWTTRWLVLVPGIALALTAVAVALIGFTVAQRYARRDVIDDLRGRGTAGLVVAVLAIFLASSLVPERFAPAREWAAASRAELRPTAEIESAFAEAGLRPIGASYAVTREITTIAQTGAARVSAGSVSLIEPFPHSSLDVPDRNRTVRSFVSGAAGGGVVEAPLVFASRGISTADYPPGPLILYGPSNDDFSKLIRNYGYADDFAGIDVRGKVVLLVRFIGFKPRPPRNSFNYARGPFPDESIANAIKRGAAAVIFVDPALWLYTDLPAGATYALGDIEGGINPYLRAEQQHPPAGTSGVPVVVLGDVAARQFVEPFGIDLSPFFKQDERTSEAPGLSVSRDLGVTARVEVPLQRQTASVTSHVAEVANAPEDAARIVVWSIKRPGAPHPSTDVLAAVSRALAPRRVPFIFVDFDPSLDPEANTKSISEVLKDRRIALVVVLDRLDGPTLRFTTPYGDLIPALDRYAEEAGARYQRTLETSRIAAIDEVAPFFDVKTVLVDGSRGDGDPRADAAALVGYIAGRLALGAEELPR
ncbi:MAG TPA: ABC transporter permease subunit [Candidatus Limnocylindria bacterium]|nr:ABC transporter permease subunit [Candidatus Limnocylindria bacterium]